MRAVTASDASRRFSGLLRDVASGESVLILSRGTPVATIHPVDARPDRTAAWKALMRHLDQQKASGHRNWTRNELYDD